MNEYKDVRSVLVENNTLLRSELRSAFSAKGLRQLSVCTSMKSLIEVVEQQTLDLIVCDADMLGTDFTPLMQQIRNNALGRNPFVTVVATVHNAHEGQVRQVLNGGVDDLLLKPMSIAHILDRVDHLIHGRKPFVATEDYVGPTRRKNARSDEDEGNLVTAPNSLHGKIVERLDDEDIRSMIDSAIAQVEEKKAQNPQSGIERLIQRSLASLESGAFGKPPNEKELRRDFGHLVDISTEIDRRYRGTNFNHIADLAISMSDLAKRVVKSNAGLQRPDLEVLANLSDLIRRSIRAQKRAATVEQMQARVAE